ncbi:hypothetical protein HZC33_01160 [Candidatus Wolfebacteria bacterium]|nr:hypothetical protein [Candidatus Wolfebacteria bacterium]
MKFEFIISKWANFYFFIQNLSEWHFSNRKNYNILWREELGQFSPEEENSLKEFKEIHLRYPFGESYLGRQFFIEKNPWIILEQKLSQEDFINLKNIFSLLEKKFNLLWNKEEPLLLQWQKKLSDKINEPHLVKSIVDILNIIFNTSPSEFKININLLFSSPVQTGGGASIDNKSISLEISRYPLNDANHAMGIIWHETIHLCFEKQYFLPLLYKKYLNDFDTINLIKESAISSLFPNGVLGRKFLNSKNITLNAKIPKNYVKTEELIKLINIYIKKNKPLDNEYIEKVYFSISELKGILK